MEPPEQYVKLVQKRKWRHQNEVNDVILMFFLPAQVAHIYLVFIFLTLTS